MCVCVLMKTHEVKAEQLYTSDDVKVRLLPPSGGGRSSTWLVAVTN